MAEKQDCKVSLSKLPRKMVSSISYELSIPVFSKSLRYDGTDSLLVSPTFEFANASWRFRIAIQDNAIREGLIISISLVRLNFKISSQTIFSQVIFQTVDDKECDISSEYMNFKDDDSVKLCYCDDFSISRRDTVSVIIDLLHIESAKEEADQASAATNKDVEALSQDFKKLLLNGKNYDLTLRVADKEFRVHRDVLMARSQVFESMLSHDMREKNEGNINVSDCNPAAMEELLLFVYCGKVESLSLDNVLGLYYAADKYQMLSLKEKCCKFLKQSLSPSIICDVVQLALNHSDSELLECATKYFVNHTSEIFPTVKWISFMKSNTIAANELLLESTKMWHSTKS